MPTSKSVLFLLASVAMQNKKQHNKEKFINGNSETKERKMNKETERRKRILTLFRHYPPLSLSIYMFHNS